MTLRGKKNHYNVKLLSGYGVAIHLKDNKIILKNGYDPFTGKQETESWFITQLPYEKLVISGKGYISTEALKLLNENYRNVILTDTFGNPVSLMNGVMDSMTASRYRIGQYDTFRDPVKCQYLIRQTLVAKLESQIKFLESLKRNDSFDTIQKLFRIKNQIENSVEPVKLEAKASLVYFRYYSSLFDPKYKFESRNQSGLKITKKRASDPINALLNYGFTVLAGEISKFVTGFGLDPYYGFMHKQHSGFQPLVYDLMEPFRWLVEYAVYHVANTKDDRHNIRLKDYVWTKDGQIILSYDLKRKFLEKLERTFQKERPYKFKHGIKNCKGFSMCQEITIVKIFVQRLNEQCTQIS